MFVFDFTAPGRNSAIPTVCERSPRRVCPERYGARGTGARRRTQHERWVGGCFCSWCRLIVFVCIWCTRQQKLKHKSETVAAAATAAARNQERSTKRVGCGNAQNGAKQNVTSLLVFGVRYMTDGKTTCNNYPGTFSCG